ncbi:transcriptional regulator GcvA [Azospirillum soli]|uniref:transcriptional regulator GcvA n=1 Tax=Azospirillum soli TaxID=1304799 RepID=UPI001AE2AE10|nr:transcriptional regulator GcvA [Azospirillum soli]MBP2315422.1 LysR family glycine cleavage system transcriptional activator [Azospirillum soli]
MRKRVSIKAVQAFEAAVRLGSFALAAEDLAVTPSAVSHQVKLLEEQLGVRLFHRAHRAVVLTDAGRHYAEEVTAAFARIEAATQTVGMMGGGAILTVHSTPSFATQWLMPRLARFKELRPGIDIRLHASVAPVDLAQGIVDVDIRYNPGPPPAGAVMVPFPEDTIVPMCSPALANGLIPIRRPEDLARHALIHSEINIVGWRDWGRRHRKVQLDLERGPRFDRSFMAISAAVDGLGVCLDSVLLAERELLAGKLVAPFPRDSMKAQGHGLVTLKSTADLPKIRAFREWLFAELEEGRQRMEQFLKGTWSHP